MASTPIAFDMDARVIRAGEWVLPLDSIERLWLMAVVFYGIPDDWEYRWVFQTSHEVILAPHLSLQTEAHAQALDEWGRATKRMYIVERQGWPMYWGTWRFAWSAFRKRCERFDLRVWQKVVDRDASIIGPCDLEAQLDARRLWMI